MNDPFAARIKLPRTAYLDHTLRRARTAAEHRSHRHVTLEHLLLALLDDPDAAKLLQKTGADVALIHSTVAHAVNNRMASLSAPDAPPPSFSCRFDALLQRANKEALSLGRPEIDGALALIAIAKDAESSASGILAANGFDAQAALRLLSKPCQRPQARPHSRPATSASMAGIASPASGDEIMDDMVASVRTIIEAEERKECEPPSWEPPPPPVSQFNGSGALHLAERAAEPSSRLSPMAARTPFSMPLAEAAQAEGFFEAPAPAFGRENAPQPEKRAGPSARRLPGRAGRLALLAKVVDAIPRKARVGVPQKVQISLSREEAGLLFARNSARLPNEPTASHGPCRAVTIRMSAPKGAFLIQTLAPETQWLAASAEDAGFGSWSWTALPKERGVSSLKVSFTARDVGPNGLLAAAVLPDQTVKVRVRANVWAEFERFASDVFFMLAGGGLAAAAYYAWQIASKLP